MTAGGSGAWGAGPTPFILQSRSEADTERFADALAFVLGPGDVVALQGPLGAGKTMLSRALCAALDVPASAGVASPTYALVHLYEGGRVPVAHLDLYRLGDAEELEALGFRDLLDGSWLMLVEWPERIAEVLELATWSVRIDDRGPTERELRVTASRQPALTRLARRLELPAA